MTTKTVYNRVEANLDVYTNRFKGTDNIFGCGDLRPMGFSKSGNTAFTEGQNVARVVADVFKNKTKMDIPHNILSIYSIKNPKGEYP